MKILISLLPIFLLGCASSFRTNPTDIKLVVERPTIRCAEIDKTAYILLTVKNQGRSNLRIQVKNSKGPPYTLSWLSYDVLKSNGRPSVDHGPGGHGPILPDVLSIGPRDSTTLLAPFYAALPDSHQSRFHIRIEDEDQNAYITDDFSPCLP